MKKVLSIFLATIIVLSGLPIGDFVAWAADEVPVVKGVVVTKTYSSPNEIKVIYIEVNGEHLDKLGKNPVIVRDEAGKPSALTIIVENDKKLYYEIKNPVGVTKLSVDGEDYNIGQTQMPSITNIEPLNKLVSNKDELIINGSGFTETDLKTRFYNKSGSLDPEGTIDIGEEKITKKFLPGTIGGPYRLEFERTIDKLIIEDNYPNLFTVYGELNVSNDITMIPNRGPTGTEVKIKGKELTGEMSVFFLKKNDDSGPYKVDNRGIKVSYGNNVEKDEQGKDTIDVYTVKVPKELAQGRYYVVLTNNVNDKTNLEGEIVSTKLFDNNIFTVVDSDNAISILDVSPGRGPETGIDAIIQGQYIGTLSENVFTPEEGIIPKVDDTTLSSNTLKVTYGERNGTESIGRYKFVGGEDGVDVTHIERGITVRMGNIATFRKGSTFGKDMDKINIKVPSVSLSEGEDPAKPVIVDVETTIYYKDKDGKPKTLVITEQGIWKEKFIFEAINYKPKIITIVPDRIPVDQNNEIAESFKISIIGENFVKYRYKDKDGNIKVKQPVIDLGGQIILDPNITGSNDPKRVPAPDIKIFDKNGIEIDGTPGNDLGTKILITVPKGKKVNPDITDIISRLKVTNPIKNDGEIKNDDPDKHMGLSGDGEIRFVKVTSDKTPKIIDVSPNTINTDGQKDIKIIGQNFSEKFNLYMDGEKINSAKRNGTGTQIIFDAQANNEGYVQLIVQNDDGALAVFDKFLYVKTYTNPKITDFNPKKGTANTLVDLKGQNLVPPNPLVKDLSGIGFMKLVGTRVFIGGNDINTYNTELKVYDTIGNDPIISAKENSIIPSDYYHSIILEDESKTYYKIHLDIFLGKYFLTDGDKDAYEIIAQGEKLIGMKGGSQFDVTVGTDKITIDGKILTIKTPYATEKKDGVERITGNRVMVKNNNELFFIVPPQPREGFYDVAIVNPDTKSDERKGNAGFYYFFQPGDEPPEIKRIEPNEGSTDGQYDILIYGENFVDRGTDQKSTVIIGGIVVPPQDIKVSADNKILTVRVPKYPGDLASETDMDRKYVNVSVINPGGASDHKINGFAYIIPISHPKITKLILNKGTAAGGEIITIEGSDFRYFEPFKDADNNGTWNLGETYTDKNKNGIWDDLRKKDVFDKLKVDWDKNILPILPTVYFGGKPAKIKSFTASTIDIETPKGIKGPVQVYLVNNDYGVSNTIIFNYEASNPKINTITPPSGKKQGNDKVEILGEGFALSDISVYTDSKELDTKKIVQVQFANLTDLNMSNSTLSMDKPNSGRIKDRTTNVKVGNLTINYSAIEDDPNINASIIENNIEYKLDDIVYNNGEVFLPVNLLKNDKGESYNGYELVRIRLERIEGANTTNRLQVDRGFSPNATLSNPGHINVTTPSYYTIGDITIRVINPDNSMAPGTFKYRNPDSKPTITNILRDNEEGYMVDDGRKIVQVNNSGGNTIEVIGTDFRKPVTIRIGDSIVISHKNIEYIPENESIATKLIFKMPAVGKEHVNTYQRLIVENEDGGFIGSDSAKPPIYINITKPESTGLAITKVTPNIGPTEGGTTVTIEGKDFRATMDGYPTGELKVYFGSGSNQVKVAKEDIISVVFDKIVLRTPKGTAGLVTIKVENPDGNIAELPKAFTYVSNPHINEVVNPDNETITIDNISVEGGDEIRILGSDFMPGAKVVFNPVLTKVVDRKKTTGEIITIGTEVYVLESGKEGTGVEFVNGQVINVTTPPGKLDDKGIIVINPDKGATNIYNIDYGMPEIGSPFDVRADEVFDELIRVNWVGVKDAFEYEIYMSEDNGRFEFVGSTELTSYSFQKIKKRTKYQFLIKAIGKYGTSKPIRESKSNTVTTGRNSGPTDEDGELAENTVIERNGNIADIVIGTEEFRNKGMIIDLTKGDLAGVKDITIRISASIVSNARGDITIIGKDYRMNFSPSIFNNPTIEKNRNDSEVGVVFKVTTHKENIKMKPGTAIVGGRYMLEGMIYIGKYTSPMDYLNGSLGLVLDKDPIKSQNGRINNIQMVRYDENTNAWISTDFAHKLGLYTVIGSRR